MEYKEIIKFWKRDDLFKCSIDEIKEFNLPESTVYFLTNIGVIINDKFMKKCNYKFLNKLVIENIDGENYVKFAKFSLPQIGLYIKQLTGEIFFISKDSSNKLMYCNKSIEDYIIFETIRFKFLSKYPEVEDDDMEAYNYAREVLKYFLEISDKSIYKNSYWFNKLADYAEGYISDNYDKIKKAITENKYMTFDDAFYDIVLNGINF